MVRFNVITNNCSEVFSFVDETNTRLQDKHWVSNPFHGEVKYLGSRENKVYWDVDLTPLWFDFTPYLALIILSVAIIFGWSWWLIIPCLILPLHFFWTKTFMFLMFKKGLVKKGYSGKVKRIYNYELNKIGVKVKNKYW